MICDYSGRSSGVLLMDEDDQALPAEMIKLLNFSLYFIYKFYD